MEVVRGCERRGEQKKKKGQKRNKIQNSFPAFPLSLRLLLALFFLFLLTREQAS